MNSRCLHSFPFNLNRIKFLVADWIVFFLLSQFSCSFPYLSYRLMKTLSKVEMRRGSSNPLLDFVSLSLTVYFLPLFGIIILFLFVCDDNPKTKKKKKKKLLKMPAARIKFYIFNFHIFWLSKYLKLLQSIILISAKLSDVNQFFLVDIFPCNTLKVQLVFHQYVHNEATYCNYQKIFESKVLLL